METQPAKVCSNCGTVVPYSANFCPNCGFRLISKPPEERITASKVFGFIRPGWIKAVLIAFAVELAAFFLLTVLPMSPAQVSAVASQGNGLVNSIHSDPYALQIAEIFLNNFRIASVEMVPVIGWFLFGFSTYSTAQVVEAFAIQAGLPGPYVMFSLLLLPHSWLELPAYSIALTQSIFLIRSAFKGQFKLELLRSLAVWVFIGIELLVAALFESTEIQLEQPNPALSFVTWIPFFVLAYVLALATRNMRSKQVAA
ncbi:MAG: stage II sporulation protein M [Thermoprotei archaeon]